GRRRASARVVEDDAEGIALAAAQAAYAVAEFHPIVTARAAHRALVDGEDHGVASAERDDFDTGLHARALLSQDEFAAVEIDTRRRQKHRNLQWKHFIAVEILVQTIVIAGLVTQQQRRRA